MTRTRAGIAGALLASAAAPALAQPVAGLYLGAGAGYGFLQGQSVQSPAGIVSGARFGGGVAALGSVGFGIGNGLRLELEGSWRDNGQSDGRDGSVGETKAGVMVNALFDFDTGLDWLYPYVGLGGGYQWTRWSGLQLGTSVPGSTASGELSASGSSGLPAYQAILGASLPIDAVPGLSVTVEYRFMALSGTRDYDATERGAGLIGPTRAHSTDDANHAVMLGLRYAFQGRDSGAVPRPRLAAPSDAAAPTRTYLVFFAADSAALSAHARDIVAEAVRNSARVSHTRLEVAGSAAGAGAALPPQRAAAVVQEVQRWGIPARQIAVRGAAEPAAAGQQPAARVEIVYR